MRLKEYANYYKQLQINGLHYVNFVTDNNIISISKSSHSTHHEATSFLLSGKNSGLSPNTVKGQANDIKKFLDFLSIWQMDVMDGDLLIILSGFVDYLRLIETATKPRRTIEWSMLSYIPLHEMAMNHDTVTTIGMDEHGKRAEQEWGQIPPETIGKIISSTIQYLESLKKKTYKYSDLPLEQLPVKQQSTDSLLSGTLGPSKAIKFDIKSILMQSNINLKTGSNRRYEPLKAEIITPVQMNMFLSEIDSRDRQNLFLFHVLKVFGLRASESANLMIDTSCLTRDVLYKMDFLEAGEYLKEHLKGDIEFVKGIGKWVCNVVNRNTEETSSNSRNKTGDREIPLLFSQDEFTSLFLNALKERDLYMRKYQRVHNYIFISKRSSHSGKPISSKSVAEKYRNLTKKMLKNTKLDFTMYSPHTFRHYFATYLLRVMKKDIEDVQRWLGHSDDKTTKGTYSHYLHDNDNAPIDIVRDMSDTFRSI